MRAIVFACLLVLGACSVASPGFSMDGGERALCGPWRLELTDASGRQLPTFERGGRTYVLGDQGQRYSLRIRNGSPRRIEAVVSVDGRDAVDGKSARWEKTGYVVAPYSEVVIDGFRLSMRDVATFRFSSVARSYAAQTGDARQVGVVGVAIYTEQAPPRRPMIRDSRPDDEYDRGAGEPRRDQAEKSESAPAAAPEGRAKAGAAAERGGGDRPASADRRAENRPGLGTEFGERRTSQVYTVDFRRAHRHPDAVLAVRYNDEAGLLALGIDLDRRRWPDRDELERRETARPFGNAPAFAPPPPGWR